MPVLQSPGTYVTEQGFQSYTPSIAGNSTAVFIGAHNKGPTTPVLVTSWGMFQRLYGGLSPAAVPSNLALAVYCYFAGGGAQCYAVRVIDSGTAVSSALTLNDASAGASLKISAANPGVWGNQIYVDVITSGLPSGQFSLAVRYGSAAGPILETWNNLSMTAGIANYALTVVNNPLAGSGLISLSLPASPSGLIPVAVSGTQLGTGSGSVAGVDGSTPSSSAYTATTALLDPIDSPLLINVPGISDTTNIITPLITYVSSQRQFLDSVIVVDPAPGQTPGQLTSYAISLGSSSYATTYAPYLAINDPASNIPGSRRLVPPGAYVLGAIAQSDTSRGVQKAPAGYGTVLPVLGVETSFTLSDLATLNNSNVNAIRNIQNVGVCIMGGRTLSSALPVRYLNVRRTLIYIENNARALTNFTVFEDNDWVLWASVTAKLNNFLTGFWASGGLAGANAAQAFFVQCDSTNNTPTSVAQGILNITIGVAPQNPVEYVIINVSQWAGGSSVNESV